MLSRKTRKPPPENCDECEFSFAQEDPHGDDLVTCIRDRSQHRKQQALCPWYRRQRQEDLEVLLGKVVPQWEVATEIWLLPRPPSIEGILNIIEGNAGLNLAKVQEEKNEK